MKSSIESAGFFLARIPAYSLDWLRHNLSTTGDSLHLPLNDNDVREAIEVASPLLTESVSQRYQGESITPAAELAIWRYIIRMASRSTPFGLFASVGIGYITQQTQTQLGNRLARHRPDSSVLVSISNLLLADKTIRTKLRYRLNNSCYPVVDEYRFSQRLALQGGHKIDLIAYSMTPYLTRLVDSFKQQQLQSFESLCEGVNGGDQEQVISFLHTLIDDGFLQSELAIPVTGMAMNDYLLATLNGLPCGADLAQMLVSDSGQPVSQIKTHLRQTLRNLGQHTATATSPPQIKRVNEANERVSTQPAASFNDPFGADPETSGLNPLPKAANLLQTDSFLQNQTLTLRKGLVKKITDALQPLSPLLRSPAIPDLSQFIERFQRRFDSQQIPLLIALDRTCGVGYNVVSRLDDSLLNELVMDAPLVPSSSVSPTLTRLLNEIYQRHQLEKEYAIELPHWILNQQQQTKPFPFSSALFGELYIAASDDSSQQNSTAASAIKQDKDNDCRFLVKNLTGPSAATLLGRFCYGDDTLRRQLKHLLDREQNAYPADILAEIVHLPTDRTGNIVARPQLRPYEIPYLSPASVAESHTLYLSDMLVSVTGGEVVLYNSKLNKRIRPRLSNAHNTRLGDEVYRFLSDVAKQDVTTLSWHWHHLSRLPFLPRVTYRNLILSRARWTISAPLPAGQKNQMASLINRYSLPSKVVLAQGDNELLLDLMTPVGRSLFVESVGKLQTGEHLVFFESLPDALAPAYTPYIRHDNQSFVSELVIPLEYIEPTIGTERELDTTAKDTDISSALLSPSPVLRRIFPPGSEWLYLKVYGSDEVLESILISLMTTSEVQEYGDNPPNKAFLGTAPAAAGAESFFFIRYNDPERHLRLRWKINPSQVGEHIQHWNQCLQPLLDQRLIHRLDYSTYEREVERYTPWMLPLCEDLFAIDSQFVIACLKGEKELDEAVPDRYALAIKSILCLLADFGLSTPQMQLLMRQLQKTFWQEHGGSAALKSSLNKLYRSFGGHWFSPLPEFQLKLLNARTGAWQSTIHQMLQLKTQASLTENRWQQLLTALIHMSMNRLLGTEARTHELLIYHFLARHLDSATAIEKATTGYSNAKKGTRVVEKRAA